MATIGAIKDFENHPECKSCKANVEYGYGPPHDASDRCESGGYNHCSCDACF